MIPIFTTGIVFACIYGICKMLIQRKERIILVNKIGENIGENCIRLLSEGFSRKSFFSTLTIGCLMLGVGLGFSLGFGLVETFITPQMGHAHNACARRLSDTATIIYFASVFIMGGISLIVAFLVEKKQACKMVA